MGCQNQCNSNTCNLPNYYENEIVSQDVSIKNTTKNLLYSPNATNAKTGCKEILFHEY